MFPAWANYLLPLIFFLGIGGMTYVPMLVSLGASPQTTAVGYAPVQPVAFSHAMHAGQLGMDCRYCHTTVDKAAFAAIPPTQTCMNCHSHIKADSPKIAAVLESYQTGRPIPWVKVHDLPDYSYFNHAAHVNQGIGCVTCHGRIDKMEVVHQQQPLSMSWCLECHRNPEKFLRPRDQVTNMTWNPQVDAGQSQEQIGNQLKQQHNILDAAALTSCSTCHR
ncbi:MAG: cytochrome c3 family protein [Phycisphaeraceae bacterium]|nr:cytochrome c3 family protein [Phycisphaeraceae bacterium]